ncbi:Ankyrin repeat family A protein 2 [Penaeus vannamei]|uniref:Ankyrin repeat family A protein 2 n=1 Tax=Penaeus vannamei TaxID=6689 RepID=A0A423TG92_PENVA|nr:Ankyrin repeat family A protein 2 [Penaeus vannamei]
MEIPVFLLILAGVATNPPTTPTLPRPEESSEDSPEESHDESSDLDPALAAKREEGVLGTEGASDQPEGEMSSSSEDDSHMIVKEEDIGDDMDLWESQPRRSAFSPYRPVTVLTNLQRGNIQTHTPQFNGIWKSYASQSHSSNLKPLILQPNFSDVDVDEVDGNGFSPIMWAASYGQLPTVRLLIQNRAKVDMEGEDGETALLLSSANGHHEIVKLLISCGANPNHVDHMGNTALMYAAHNDHSHCANELLEHGADLSTTNVAGITAFHIAVTRGSKQVQLIMERQLLKLVEPS